MDMKTFVGVKVVRATPMTRAEYLFFRGWQVPADEDPTDKGYLVEYTDGGKPNTVLPGYASWSPEEQFNNAYSEVKPEEAEEIRTFCQLVITGE